MDKTTSHDATLASVVKVSQSIGGLWSTGMLYRLSVHTRIASITGTLVYNDDTSKLIIISSSSRITVFSLSHILSWSRN